MPANLQVVEDGDFEEIVADAPNDTLQGMQTIDDKSKALEQSARDFMRAHASSQEEVSQLRRQMWEELTERFNLDVKNYVYTVASYKGEPKIVKLEKI